MRRADLVGLLFSFIALVGLPSAPAQSTVVAPVPSAALQQLATQHAFPVGVADPQLFTGPIGIGDELAFLADLREGSVHRQWLIRMRWQAPGTGGGKPVIRYASSGDELAYSTAKGSLEVSTLGPISVPTRAVSGLPLETKSMQVETDYLELGFYANARLWAAVRERKAADPALPDFWFFTNRGKPVDAGTATAQRAVLAAYGIDATDLRVLGSDGIAFDALMLQLSKTPGVSDILWQIADKPSAFSMLRGLRTAVSHYEADLQLDLAPTQLPLPVPPAVQHYLVNFNGTNSLRLDLHAVPSQGVLLQSAGVVALVARPADVAVEKTLVVTLMGARRAR